MFLQRAHSKERNNGLACKATKKCESDDESWELQCLRSSIKLSKMDEYWGNVWQVVSSNDMCSFRYTQERSSLASNLFRFWWSHIIRLHEWCSQLQEKKSELVAGPIRNLTKNLCCWINSAFISHNKELQLIVKHPTWKHRWKAQRHINCLSDKNINHHNFHLASWRDLIFYHSCRIYVPFYDHIHPINKHEHDQSSQKRMRALRNAWWEQLNVL